MTCKVYFFWCHAYNHILEAIISFKSACLANSKWWMTFTNRHVKFNLQLSENLMWNFSKDTISLQKRQVSLLGDLTRYNAEKSLRRLHCSCVSGLNIFTWQLKCNYQPRSRRSRCYRLLNCCIRGEVSTQHRSACLCLGIWHGTMQKKVYGGCSVHACLVWISLYDN